MAGINDECIDLIYLDPPFNKNKKFTAPIGSSAEGASFKDIFREDDVKKEWLWTIKEDHPELFHFLDGINGVGKPYNFAYLAYMSIRMIECHRILKETGSIYLHCDPTMSHYLKVMMDCIFGENNFRNEVIWQYFMGGKSTKDFARKHDVIFRYVKSNKWTFNKLKIKRRLDFIPTLKDDSKDAQSGMDELGYWSLVLCPDVWQIKSVFNMSKQYVGYPTQKPVDLLERIIQTSTNEGDVILDPFCGCATTCVAAEKLDRQWIGIDISVKAYELVQERLKKEIDKPQQDFFKGDTAINLKTDPPKRTDQETDYREQKFVYVISHPNFDGEYKVGIAKDWKSRLNSYQTSDPERQYKMEFNLETPWFRETEKYIHDLFPNKHEWVQGDLDSIIEAIKTHKPVSIERQDELGL